VGVYSLRRLQTRDESLFAARALKLISHEAGHILSIPHCVRWRCVMQGANSALEQDGQPFHPCPEDARKMEWACGFDRQERNGRLAAFYERAGFAADAEWIRSRPAR